VASKEANGKTEVREFEAPPRELVAARGAEHCRCPSRHHRII
jgi:hypothetical protein